MIEEVEEEPRLVVNVLEANEQELKTETLFDGLEVFKSKVWARDN